MQLGDVIKDTPLFRGARHYFRKKSGARVAITAADAIIRPVINF